MTSYGDDLSKHRFMFTQPDGTKPISESMMTLVASLVASSWHRLNRESLAGRKPLNIKGESNKQSISSIHPFNRVNMVVTDGTAPMGCQDTCSRHCGVGRSVRAKEGLNSVEIYDVVMWAVSSCVWNCRLLMISTFYLRAVTQTYTIL